MLVTVSGLPGSGTSTVARAVSAELDVEHVDGGTLFRRMAAEREMSLAEFASLAERDDSIDRDLDARLTDLALRGGVLLESRLAGWLAHRAGAEGLLVWIDCEDLERARRVGGRDGRSLDAAVEENRVREASERSRYLGYYGIDLTDLTPYGLIVDSTDRPPEEIVTEIVAAVGASA